MTALSSVRSSVLIAPNTRPPLHLHPHSKQWSLAVASVALALNAAAVKADTANNSSGPATARPGIVTAHPDGQCLKPLSNGTKVEFQFKTGFPSFDTYPAQQFPGAETPGNGGGYVVWFNMPQPSPGCRNQLMVPYPYQHHDESIPGPGGIVLVNSNRAGCYSALLQTNEPLLLSYCCGVGDCGAVAFNNDPIFLDLAEGSANPPLPPEMNTTVPKPSGTGTAPSSTGTAPSTAVGSTAPVGTQASNSSQTEIKRYTGSIAARAREERRWLYPRPPPPATNDSCKYPVGTPYSRLGKQQLVAGLSVCSQASCSFTVTHASSEGTTMSSSHTQTLTNSVGGSVGVTTGADFLGKSTVTATITTDFSKAVAETTGKDIQKGNTTTISLTWPVQNGQNMGVTFSPLYTCYMGTMTCDKKDMEGITTCQPDMDTNGVTQKGVHRSIAAG